MSDLRLRLLGSPRIEVDGLPIEVNRQKAVALLTYLAVTGQAQQRDTLAALLWPDSSQSLARNSLRRDLSILNKALGDEHLAIEREAIELHRAGLWLDVAQFRLYLTECRKHGHPDNAVCSACLQPLAAAAELYHDDFMAGFSLPDCPDFDEWQFFQTETLRQELASVLEKLVQGYSIQANYESALPYARRWLALDNLNELAHRQLMRLYARTGQKAAALRQYQSCTQVLEDELGVEPSTDTTALYEQIRATDLSTAAIEQETGKGYVDTPLHPTTHTLPHNLPVPTTPFVGRVEGLAEVVRRLNDPACRLLTLVGPGGIGKTRLAIRAAQKLATDSFNQAIFAHGVYFVRLASISSPNDLIPAIAEVLSFSVKQDVEPKEELFDYLHKKEMLLVLDNFEHLLTLPLKEGRSEETEFEQEQTESATLIADILSVEPGIKVLVTSREALNLQGEWVYPVEGMRYPSAEVMNAGASPADIEEYSAVRLFAQSARRVQPDFSLSAELDCVLHICRLVEGMPLAIELAASWLKLLSCPEIARQIEQSLDFLTTPVRNVPARHRSMRAIFEHSWQLLSQTEQDILRRLSEFKGGFQQEDAEQVAGASLLQLAALVDKSILRVTPTGHYRMHEMLRQFAAEKLQETTQDKEQTN